MKTTFELKANHYNKRGTFYGKANVIMTDEVIALQSYDTIVCEVDKATGEIYRTWAGYSATTNKHIHEFMIFLNNIGVISVDNYLFCSKSEWAKREYRKATVETVPTSYRATYY